MDADLVDWPRFERFAAAASLQTARDLVEGSLESARASCDRMRAQISRPEEIAKEAHRLRGSMGMLGLNRIGVVAGNIEDATSAGGDLSGLVEELSIAIQQTCSEFRGRKTADT